MKTTIVRRLFATCEEASRSQDARGPQPGGLTPAEVPGSAQDVNRPVHHEASVHPPIITFKIHSPEHLQIDGKHVII